MLPGALFRIKGKVTFGITTATHFYGYRDESILRHLLNYCKFIYRTVSMLTRIYCILWVFFIRISVKCQITVLENKNIQDITDWVIKNKRFIYFITPINHTSKRLLNFYRISIAMENHS